MIACLNWLGSSGTPEMLSRFPRIVSPKKRGLLVGQRQFRPERHEPDSSRKKPDQRGINKVTVARGRKEIGADPGDCGDYQQRESRNKERKSFSK